MTEAAWRALVAEKMRRMEERDREERLSPLHICDPGRVPSEWSTDENDCEND